MHLCQCNGPAKAATVLDWLVRDSSSVQWSLTIELDSKFRSWWVKPRLPSRPRWRKAGQSEGHCIDDLSARKRKAEFDEACLPKARWITLQPKRTWPLTHARASAHITPGRGDGTHACFTQSLANDTLENSRRRGAFTRIVRESISGLKNVSAAGFVVPIRKGIPYPTLLPATRNRQMKHQTFEKGGDTSFCTSKGSSPEREWRRPR